MKSEYSPDNRNIKADDGLPFGSLSLLRKAIVCLAFVSYLVQLVLGLMLLFALIYAYLVGALDLGLISLVGYIFLALLGLWFVIFSPMKLKRLIKLVKLKRWSEIFDWFQYIG